MNIRIILLAALCMVLAETKSFATVTPSDTTIIEFTDKGVRKRVTVLTEGDKNFVVPRILNLENLLREIGVDSSERKKAVFMIEDGQGVQDTILVVARDGRAVKIVIRNPFPDRVSENDTIPGSKSDRWSRGDGQERRNDYDEDDDEDDVEKFGKKRFFSKSDFGFYLGLNGWSNNDPMAPNQLTELRTGRSRYIALSLRKNATLLNTEKVDIALSVGPEIAWYNFMLKNSNIVQTEKAQSGVDQVQFVDSGLDLSKSKLVMPYLNLPVLVNFGFEKSQFQIGVGGYVGYRIGGYSKTKDDDRNKERLKESYGMDYLFYGVTGEVGRRRGLKLFFRYDLTPMFKNNQVNARELQAWSVGVRI